MNSRKSSNAVGFLASSTTKRIVRAMADEHLRTVLGPEVA